MSDPRPYALERGGCWHAVTQAGEGGRWTSVCGMTGEPYAGQPSSVTYLAGPPSPLHCHHPGGEAARPPRGLRMQQLVSVNDYGLGHITSMKNEYGVWRYHVRLVAIPGQPAKGVTVTRDQIKD